MFFIKLKYIKSFLVFSLLVSFACKTTASCVEASEYQYPTEEQVVNKELDSDPPEDYGDDEIENPCNCSTWDSYSEILTYPPNRALGGRALVKKEDETFKWKSFNIFLNHDDFDDAELRVIHESAYILHKVLSYPPCSIHVGIWKKGKTPYGDYIHIFKGSDSGVFVGRKGGRQDLKLCRACFYKCEIVHFLLHALGFQHEHSRQDRDKYIQVIWENIKEYEKRFFLIEDKSSTIGTEYDEGSVMHFNALRYSKTDGWPVMASKRGKRLGCDNKDILSPKDVEMLQKVYCR